MPRKTVYLSEHTEQLVDDLAAEGESFSAAVSRLIEAGARVLQEGKVPRYVGIASGPGDEIGRKVEEYLREVAESVEPPVYEPRRD